MRAPSDKFIRRLIWILLALAIFFIGTAFYIPAKAMLSQSLLQRSWTRTVAEQGGINKPWPWSASWPVARLRIPEHGIDELVLEGENLHSRHHLPDTGMFSTQDRNTGTVMIDAEGRKNSRLLKSIALGEYFQLQDDTGASAFYRVEDLQIIDIRYGAISMPRHGKWLLLIARYPSGVGADDSGKRYVVSALRTARKNNPTQDI